jgi:hypothetical protein
MFAQNSDPGQSNLCYSFNIILLFPSVLQEEFFNMLPH